MMTKYQLTSELILEILGEGAKGGQAFPLLFLSYKYNYSKVLTLT